MAERNLGTMTDKGKSTWAAFKQAMKADGHVGSGRTLGSDLTLEFEMRRAPGSLRSVVVPAGANMTGFFLITQAKTGSSRKDVKLRGRVWSEAIFEWPEHTLSVKSDGTLWMSGDDTSIAVVTQ